MSLSLLAKRHGTDKLLHGYCPHYERHLSDLRSLPIRLVEIGIAKGGSLRMWADFFPDGEIIGVDVNPTCVVRGARITSITADVKTVALDGPFDVIIDDGSHLASEIVLTWNRLWSLVKPGGWYIVEDWSTQWLPVTNWPYSEGRVNGSVASDLVDQMVHAVLSTQMTDIEEIHIYRQLLFLRKKE